MTNVNHKNKMGIIMKMTKCKHLAIFCLGYIKNDDFYVIYCIIKKI